MKNITLDLINGQRFEIQSMQNEEFQTLIDGAKKQTFKNLTLSTPNGIINMDHVVRLSWEEAVEIIS